MKHSYSLEYWFASFRARIPLYHVDKFVYNDLIDMYNMGGEL